MANRYGNLLFRLILWRGKPQSHALLLLVDTISGFCVDQQWNDTRGSN
jgi:hypothetical protein